MTLIPPKSPLSLVKQADRAVFQASDLNDIKYNALFNQVMLLSQTLEQLQNTIHSNTKLLQQMLGVIEKG